ncbi:hypothetical protein AK812_SmicGene37998 [Symbiodinium microadriaticum]|uniref:Uncharacterized protein n=1 Tax=Symbiodinium microadriaticum TaxID=2951 RepID=A0A1Q9CF40_SYMMI|nr:hypothetical protein AK812_SmicGene37998 [Symbiodinium microadriaticum]
MEASVEGGRAWRSRTPKFLTGAERSMPGTMQSSKMVSTYIRQRQQKVMRSCHASGIGGAISLRGNLHLDAATFTSCYAPASSAFMASGDASVGDLSLHGSTGMRAVSASRMKTGDVGCLDAPDCTLEAMEVASCLTV